MNARDREAILHAATTLCCIGNAENQPGIRLAGRQLAEIAQRCQRVWPTDFPVLKYDSFAQTWSLSGLSQEVFFDNACKILGGEPREGMRVKATITVELIGEPEE